MLKGRALRPVQLRRVWQSAQQSTLLSGGDGGGAERIFAVDKCASFLANFGELALAGERLAQDAEMNETEILYSNNQTENFKNSSWPNPSPYSSIDIATFMHIFPSIYGILCAVGVIANGLVIYAVAACKKKMVSDIYVLNLAIADMLFLLVMPFNIHQLIRDRQWVFGNFMCKAVVVVDVSNQFTTVGIVTVLCIDRYIAIVHPMSERRTIQWTIIINLLVWVGSFLLTVPVMLYAKADKRKTLEVCIINLDGPEDMYWYTLYQSILGFIIPLIIISTFYSLTLYHVFSSIRRVKLTVVKMDGSSAVNDSSHRSTAI
uniref:G-protein coupled receptors family 1 profile domain-containing protein n=1 Tax=Knipowitschia caucasica TaxID=637954 RepID=A0AAV2MKG9_KNICA